MSTNVDDWVAQAIAAANLSPGRPRKVGALLILDDGRTLSACNDFPAGVRDLEPRHADSERLMWIEHAERNAIYGAARAGLSTAGATLVATYHPCVECARAIVQAGIATLHTLPPNLADPIWGPGFGRSSEILAEGGVAVNYLANDPAAMHAATLGRR